MADTAPPQSKPARHAKVIPGMPLNRLQAKLEVGPSGDRFEHEADRVAGQVMQGGTGAVAIPPSITPLGVQRKAAPKPNEEEKRGGKGKTAQRKALPKKPMEEEPKGTKPARVQRDTAAGSAGGMAGAGVSSATSCGVGQPWAVNTSAT